MHMVLNVEKNNLCFKADDWQEHLFGPTDIYEKAC